MRVRKRRIFDMVSVLLGDYMPLERTVHDPNIDSSARVELARVSTLALTLSLTASGCKDGKTTDEPTTAGPLSYRELVLDPVPLRAIRVAWKSPSLLAWLQQRHGARAVLAMRHTPVQVSPRHNKNQAANKPVVLASMSSTKRASRRWATTKKPRSP